MKPVVHRYPKSWLMADYARAILGLSLTAGPLMLVDPLPIFALILCILAAIFALFLARTALRQATRYRREVDGLVRCSPWGSPWGSPWRGPWGGERRLAWKDLTGLSVKYFSTQRNRENGWLMLTLKGRDGLVMRIESPIGGFADLIEQAMGAAGDAHLALDQTTIDNLTMAGYRHRNDG